MSIVGRHLTQTGILKSTRGLWTMLSEERGVEKVKSSSNMSSMKGSVLGHWEPGAGAKIPFLSKQSLNPFIHAPVCSVNDHPGEINSIR